jgi:preprotein translocase subunit SecG
MITNIKPRIFVVVMVILLILLLLHRVQLNLADHSGGLGNVGYFLSGSRGAVQSLRLWLMAHSGDH